MKFALMAILILFFVACSSINLKNVEIHKQDGSVLKIESLEAYNVDEVKLLDMLSKSE